MSATARAAAPYTAASSQYSLAGSIPPRKKPWEKLMEPCSRVEISTNRLSRSFTSSRAQVPMRAGKKGHHIEVLLSLRNASASFS
jgi:hypothetical protein